MSYCPEAAKRWAMSDAEFWEHVAGDLYLGPSENYFDDLFALSCARCGRTVEINDYWNRERDAFCDDCAAEMAEPENLMS